MMRRGMSALWQFWVRQGQGQGYGMHRHILTKTTTKTATPKGVTPR
jgi:hypothetical protein